MYQGVNTRLEKQMILLILVTMKIKVIVESERKYSFQRERSFLINLLWKILNSICFYFLFDILFIYFYVDEFLCVLIDFCFVKWINAK